jgi:phage-related protein
MKPVAFQGNSLDALKAFPQSARRMAGLQLDRVQRGLDPDNWKPMPTVGAGVREIRILDASGAFRVLYVAQFERAIYVLHCFQKKSQKTSRLDIETGQQRYRELLKGMR